MYLDPVYNTKTSISPSLDNIKRNKLLSINHVDLELQELTLHLRGFYIYTSPHVCTKLCRRISAHIYRYN